MRIRLTLSALLAVMAALLLAFASPAMAKGGTATGAQVISVTKANGQVQDTLTYTAAALDQLILTPEATGLPQSLR